MTTKCDLTTVEAALRWAVSTLDDAGINEDARVDAEALLCHSLQQTRSFLLIHPEYNVSDEQQVAFVDAVEQRKTGKPVAYITGTRGFWHFDDLHVNQHTLIPRPDTETLVEATLSHIPKQSDLTIADLGTGSGAIALALAYERPRCLVIATDVSQGALDVAQQNAVALQLSNIELRQGSWFEALPHEQRFNVIVSNPPYIARDDPHLHDGSLDHEPYSALASGQDGLDDIRLLVGQATAYLQTNGFLLLEHGYDQAEAVRKLFISNGFSAVDTLQDLGGNDRVTLGQATHVLEKP